MLPLDIQNVRAAVLAVAIDVLAIVLFNVATAHAQFSSGCGDTALDPCFVTDPSVESSVGDIDTTQLPNILQQDTTSALSLTTPGGAGLWHPQAPYLTGLNANLDQGVDTPASFIANFPGWQALPPYAVGVAKQLSTLGLNTYAGALTVAQQQVAGFQAEDSQLAGIEQVNQGVTSVLQGQQLIVEAILALCQQEQRQRELTAAQMTMEAVHDAEELQERSSAGATTAQSLNFGVAP